MKTSPAGKPTGDGERGTGTKSLGAGASADAGRGQRGCLGPLDLGDRTGGDHARLRDVDANLAVLADRDRRSIRNDEFVAGDANEVHMRLRCGRNGTQRSGRLQGWRHRNGGLLHEAKTHARDVARAATHVVGAPLGEEQHLLVLVWEAHRGSVAGLSGKALGLHPAVTVQDLCQTMEVAPHDVADDLEAGQRGAGSAGVMLQISPVGYLLKMVRHLPARARRYSAGDDWLTGPDGILETFPHEDRPHEQREHDSGKEPPQRRIDRRPAGAQRRQAHGLSVLPCEQIVWERLDELLNVEPSWDDQSFTRLDQHHDGAVGLREEPPPLLEVGVCLDDPPPREGVVELQPGHPPQRVAGHDSVRFFGLGHRRHGDQEQYQYPPRNLHYSPR